MCDLASVTLQWDQRHCYGELTLGCVWTPGNHEGSFWREAIGLDHRRRGDRGSTVRVWERKRCFVPVKPAVVGAGSDDDEFQASLRLYTDSLQGLPKEPALLTP